jgi:hypothetical protein
MADVVIDNVETWVSVRTELVSYLFVSDAKFQHSCRLRWRKITFEQSSMKWEVCHSNLMKGNKCVCTLNKLTHTHTHSHSHV